MIALRSISCFIYILITGVFSAETVPDKNVKHQKRDKLLPGDIILVDRGFDIQDGVGLRYAEANIPAFTKGKLQLSPILVVSTIE